MIASNYIKYPEALRFQCEMFSNGYKNSPRIMRLMTVIFDWKLQAPQWVKDAMAKAKRLAKMCREQQMELFSKFDNVAMSDLKTTIKPKHGFGEGLFQFGVYKTNCRALGKRLLGQSQLQYSNHVYECDAGISNFV